jgi:hypothetical protein
LHFGLLQVSNKTHDTLARSKQQYLATAQIMVGAASGAHACRRG